MLNIQQFVEYACSKESFKNNFKENPKQVLAKLGVQLPDAMHVQVHENTSVLTNYVIPDVSEISLRADLQQQNSAVAMLINAALVDQSFKTKLLQKPKSAIAEATGFHLPENQQICVYENTLMLKHIVLPANGH